MYTKVIKSVTLGFKDRPHICKKFDLTTRGKLSSVIDWAIEVGGDYPLTYHSELVVLGVEYDGLYVTKEELIGLPLREPKRARVVEFAL